MDQANPTTTDPASTTDEHGAVRADVHCLECGYNLRGLQATSTCPECGTAVSASLRDRLLQFANPAWMHKVATGMKTIIAAIVTMFVLSIGSIAVAAVSAQMMLIYSMAIAVIMAVIWSIGVWLVTEPEPGTPTPEHEQKRLGARWGIIAGQGASLIATAIQLAGLALVAGVLQFVSGIAGLVGFILLMLFLRTLAVRVPDEKLARHTLIVLIGLGVSYGLILIGTLVIVMGSGGAAAAGAGGGVGGAGGAPGIGVMVSGVFLCMAAPAVLFFAIWNLLLLDKYRRVLTDAAAKAKANMAGSSPMSA